MTKNERLEIKAYKKEKICCSCKYFSSFMGSAGYCNKQDNKITDMIDIMDTCHNGKYKFKRMKIMTKWLSFVYSFKYKLHKIIKKIKHEEPEIINFKW